MVPWIVLALALTLEIVLRRRRGWREAHAARLLLWTARPWALWAVLNLAYRRWSSLHFNDPRTFPFYAEPWRGDLGWREYLVWLAQQRAVWVWGPLALLLGLGLAVGTGWLMRKGPLSRTATAAAVIAGCLVTAAFHGVAAGVPTGVYAADDQAPVPSLLLPWHRPGDTMLYAVRHIRGSRAFVEEFADLHGRLRRYIHPHSHPPGASLALYWIGKAMGLPKGADIRVNSTKWRYAVGLTLFAAFGYAAAFALGRALGGSPSAGWLTAGLWTAAPMTVYNTFAMNGLFSVFFVFALWASWRVLTAGHRPWLTASFLGLCFFALNWLCYSWTLATTIFALFGLWQWHRRRWVWSEAVARLTWPLMLMTLLSALIIVRFRYPYLTVYRKSYEFVCGFYNFANLPQALVAWIGGQLDLWLMAGAFVMPAALAAWRRPETPWEVRGFTGLVLAVYALPVLFGPSCLRMETARCWNWVAVPVMAVAAREITAWPRAPVMGFLAVALSAAIRTGLRLFVDALG